MDPKECWKKLNQAINVKHYIGPKAHKCIEDALQGSQANEQKEKKAPQKAVAKKPIKESSE